MTKRGDRHTNFSQSDLFGLFIFVRKYLKWSRCQDVHKQSIFTKWWWWYILGSFFSKRLIIIFNLLGNPKEEVDNDDDGDELLKNYHPHYVDKLMNQFGYFAISCLSAWLHVYKMRTRMLKFQISNYYTFYIPHNSGHQPPH